MSKRTSFGDMPIKARRELAARISQVIDSYGSKAAAAVVAQLSTDQLSNIVAGKSAPSALALSRLCLGAGYSLDWLMTGRRHVVTKGDLTVDLHRAKRRFLSLISQHPDIAAAWAQLCAAEHASKEGQ